MEARTTTPTAAHTEVARPPEPVGASSAVANDVVDVALAEPEARRRPRTVPLVLATQLVLMCAWSSVLLHEWSESVDYAMREQAWWLIGHGNLDPYTTPLGRLFLHDHFELINWPLAFFGRLWPSMAWPLWWQNIFVVSAEAAVIAIVRLMMTKNWWPAEWRREGTLIALALVLALSPWTWFAVSNDYHYQTSAAMGVGLWFLYFGLRRRWVLAAVAALGTLAVADVAGTYVAAMALSLLILPRLRWRDRGYSAGFVLAGLAWGPVVAHFHGSVGSNLPVHYGYLLDQGQAHASMLDVGLGILKHPGLAFSHWSKSAESWWAYDSYSGFLGFFTPFSILPALCALQTGLAGKVGRLATIPWETLPATLLLTPCALLVWARIGSLLRSRRRYWFFRVVPVVLLTNSLVWAAIWLPQVAVDYARMAAGTSSTLTTISRIIQPDDEVVSSFGIIGMFAQRRYLYKLSTSRSTTLHTPFTDYVVTPWSDIENTTPAQSLGLVSDLLRSPNASLVVNHDQAILVQYRRPPGASVFPVQAWGQYRPIALWLSQGSGENTSCTEISQYCQVSDGDKLGVLNDGLIWNIVPGLYKVTLDLRSSANVNVQFWDNTTDTLLNQLELTPVQQDVHLDVDVTTTKRFKLFTGWGPFSFRQIHPGNENDAIEIRIAQTSPGWVKERTIQLEPAGANF